MLKHPFLDVPYQPTIREFLGDFDIYDREDTLGAEFQEYDMNSRSDRERLIRKYISERKTHLSYRHRYVLLKELAKTLENEDYDFKSLFEDDPEEYSSMPYDWDEMKDPRAFFEDIYQILKVDWEADISRVSKENPDTW